MKSSILIITILIGTFTSFSQMYILDFNYLGANRPPECNPYKTSTNYTTPWKVSHGSPACGDRGQGTYDVAHLVASFLEVDDKSEGLFLNYEFKKDHSYDIALHVAHIPGSPVSIEIYAANGIKESSNAACKEDKAPTVTDKHLIHTELVGGNALINRYSAIEKFNWTPSKKYNQLWIKSLQLYYSSTGSFYISNGYIIDNGVVSEGNTICCPQSIHEGETPTTLTGTDITGSFQWKEKIGNGNWQNIPNAKSKDYSPGVLTQSTSYRRLVDGGVSNTVLIKVAPIPVTGPICTNGEQFLLDNHLNWNTSHGYPEYSYANDHGGINNNFDAVFILRASFQCQIVNAHRKSDGVYIEHPFIAGKEYTISLYTGTIKLYNGSYQTELKLYAASNIDAHPGNPKETDTYAEKLELIGKVPYIQSADKFQFSFTPTDNYNSLWIHPHYLKWSMPCTGEYSSKWFISNVAIMVKEWAVSGAFVEQYTYVTRKAETIYTKPFALVEPGANVEFVADKQIILNDGFHAFQGSYFSAKVEDIYNECIENKRVAINTSRLLLEEEEIFENDTTPEIVVIPIEEYTEVSNPDNKESLKTTQNVTSNVKKQENNISKCQDIRIFPNPNNGIFTINTPNEFDMETLEILNSSGNIIYRTNEFKKENIELDIRNVPTGVYFIRITSKKDVLTRKILKH